jgi:hypothetical protein
MSVAIEKFKTLAGKKKAGSQAAPGIVNSHDVHLDMRVPATLHRKPYRGSGRSQCIW